MNSSAQQRYKVTFPKCLLTSSFKRDTIPVYTALAATFSNKAQSTCINGQPQQRGSKHGLRLSPAGRPAGLQVARHFALFPKFRARYGTHPASYSVDTRNPLQGAKRSEREAGHSLSQSVKVKKEWSSTSSTPVCFHGVHTDNLTFTYDPHVTSCKSSSSVYLLSDGSPLAQCHFTASVTPV